MKIDKEKLSPMMKKYLETKEEYRDCILFYRLGDFYEMFFDDALLASKVLNIALTGKACGLEERAPMCGVPYHSADTYIARMIQAGYKVAIGEQVEDPQTAKGIVKREVVKVVTPGTILDEEDERKNNYLMAIFKDEKNSSITYADISTGELNTTLIDSGKIKEEVAKISPKEIISNDKEVLSSLKSLSNMAGIFLNEDIDEKLMDTDILFDSFEKKYLDNLGITSDSVYSVSISMILNYIRRTQMMSSNNINSINIYDAKDFMILDVFTRINLELTKTIRGSKKKGSLLDVIDHTSTSMGARMLHKFIEQPLINVDEINRRLDFTEAIKNNFILREELKESLSKVYDLERICSKIAYDKVVAKDLINLKNSIWSIKNIKTTIDNSDSDILKSFSIEIDDLEDVARIIEDSILEEPSNSLKDGNIIKTEYNEKLAELRNIYNNGADIIKDIEAREREKTGIKLLKIGYNKVFGYYIEITKASLAQANLDERFIRKQTLVNAERFITEELKEIEDKIINAEDEIKSLEYEIFKEIRNSVYENIERIQIVSSKLAQLDVFLSNAIVANKNGYTKPGINTRGDFKIKDGRHPVIENIIKRENFIPNDTEISKNNLINIITGPNMSGKSTYMRQVAIISLMAHIGMFVPAESAIIPIMDRIFTRVGASDNLSEGESTFMVEMNEVSNILRNATDKSLVILDEIGRGTSTYDGISLAWSIVEYIHDYIGAKTLFATHYHELSELENKYDNIKNYSIDVREDGENILFLRKIVPHQADRSYGIYVAKLAKLPDAVIEKADKILEELEKNHIYNSDSINLVGFDRSEKNQENKQGNIFEDNADKKVIEKKEAEKKSGDDKGFKESEKDEVEEAKDKEKLDKNLKDLEKNELEEIKNINNSLIEELSSFDMMNSTPMDAMKLVYELQNKIKNADRR